MSPSNEELKIKNPYIKEMDEDVLYHLGLGTGSHDLKMMFGDVKFVCMGGTPQRMETFANFLMTELDLKLPTGSCLNDISKHSHRYAMFKVGPVLSVSHGMGVPSLSILLHEMIKLMIHAGVKDPIFFRIGTCGGIGLQSGTVVISSEALDGKLRPIHSNIVLGKDTEIPTHLDQKLADELLVLSKKCNIEAVKGKTVCTNDFYEGQGRTDGAFCGYTKEDRIDYLMHLEINGVKNIEMEAVCFSAMTSAAGIRSAIVCVCLLDRLQGDQIRSTKEAMLDWATRPQKLVAEYIKKCLSQGKSHKNNPNHDSNIKLLHTCESCFEDQTK